MSPSAFIYTVLALIASYFIVQSVDSITQGNRRVSGHRLIKKMKSCSPREFEFLCAEYLKTFEGFSSTKVTKATNDGGYDILAVKKNKRFVVECKHYSGKVGKPILYKILGVATAEHAAPIVITNSDFTANAYQFAKENKIRLISGNDISRH